MGAVGSSGWRGRTRDTPAQRLVEEKLEHVAAGRGVVVLPRSTAEFYTRQDVRWLPVSALPPTPIAVARLESTGDPLAKEFLDTAGIPLQGR